MEDENQEDSTVEVTVEADIPQDSAVPDAEDGDTTVVVVEDAPTDETVTEGEVERALAVEQRLTALELTVAGLLETVGAIDSRTQITEAVQETVIEEVSEVAANQEEMAEAVAEEVSESVNEDGGLVPTDDPPTTARKHFMFQTFGEIRERRKNR